ncbi:Ig-like domain-containing protein [Rubritalea tangerina]|uniref:Ig-like domain-containing protein n=1 Tax=Rubritalea tangerina TaxID=430798 RepID=A0ABW4Z985_9BACT
MSVSFNYDGGESCLNVGGGNSGRPPKNRKSFLWVLVLIVMGYLITPYVKDELLPLIESSTVNQPIDTSKDATIVKDFLIEAEKQQTGIHGAKGIFSSDEKNVSSLEEKVAHISAGEIVYEKGRYFERFNDLQLSSDVNPLDPPHYLRLRSETDDGNEITFFLEKYSVRGERYKVEIRESDGKIRQLKNGGVRTYRGWCEELPDTLVNAYLNEDGTVAVRLLRPMYLNGIRSSLMGPGSYSKIDVDDGVFIDVHQLKRKRKNLQTRPYQFISGSPQIQMGKPYSGASYYQPSPGDAPFFTDTTMVDQTILTSHTFFGGFTDSELTQADKEAQMNFEMSALLYDTASLRDGNECFRLSNVLLVRPVVGLDKKERKFYEDAQRGQKSDALAYVSFYGGGGAGKYRHLNKNKRYFTSANYDQAVMSHELGHLFDWGGDYHGASVEGGFTGIFDGGHYNRFGTPNVQQRYRNTKYRMDFEAFRNSVEYVDNVKFPLTPYVVCDQVRGAPDQQLVIDCLANDFDTNLDRIALEGFQKTSREGGTVRISYASDSGSSRDTLIYEPKAGFVGEDRFSYSIVDEEGRIGYGNVIVTIAPRAKELAYYSFNSVNAYNEHDLIESDTQSGLYSRVSFIDHKFRRQPFLAYWNFHRVTNRGGYYDDFKEPSCADFTGDKAAWNRKEIRLDISQQIFGDSPIGQYDVTMNRYHYYKLRGARKYASNYDHPKVMMHKLEMLVDGRIIASTRVDEEVVLEDEYPKLNAKHVSSNWSRITTGTYTWRLKVRHLTPSLRSKLNLAFNSALKKGKRNEGESKPKVELKLTMSKSPNLFTGSLRMVPVMPKLEKVKGRGGCIKVHGFEQLNYQHKKTSNNYRTLAVWCHVPEWGIKQDPYLLRYLGNTGVRPVMKGGEMVMAYNNNKVSGWDLHYFPMVPEGKWFHFAISIGDKVRIFINGDEVVSAERESYAIPFMGRLGYNIFAAYDDLYIYSGALNQEDIKKLMKLRTVHK